MYQNDISELPFLDNEKLQNIFTIHQDENESYYYNLLQSILIPDTVPDIYFINYTVQYGDTWPLISYKAYESTSLWWVIAYANNVQNPITDLKVGDVLKIPKIDFVREVLTEIQLQQQN